MFPSCAFSFQLAPEGDFLVTTVFQSSLLQSHFNLKGQAKSLVSKDYSFEYLLLSIKLRSAYPGFIEGDGGPGVFHPQSTLPHPSISKNRLKERTLFYHTHLKPPCPILTCLSLSLRYMSLSNSRRTTSGGCPPALREGAAPSRWCTLMCGGERECGRGGR